MLHTKKPGISYGMHTVIMQRPWKKWKILIKLMTLNVQYNGAPGTATTTTSKLVAELICVAVTRICIGVCDVGPSVPYHCWYLLGNICWNITRKFKRVEQNKSILAEHLIPSHLMFIFSIQALLSAPNPDDPLADNVAKHWKANETEAVETGDDLVAFLAAKYSRFFSSSAGFILCSQRVDPCLR